jgi:hypothetical protein
MIRRPRRVVALPALAALTLSVAGCGEDETPDGQPGRPSAGICEPNSAIVLGGSGSDDGRPATYVSGWEHTDHVHEVGESLIERDDGSQAIVSNASIRCQDRPR